MANDNENSLQQKGDESAENNDRQRMDQFNELSELSLEERMAMADKIGIPVRNADEATLISTMSENDTNTGGLANRTSEENAGEGLGGALGRS